MDKQQYVASAIIGVWIKKTSEVNPTQNYPNESIVAFKDWDGDLGVTNACPNTH